jgi:pyridoxamine 5'-phosphate oxidase
LLRTFDDSGFVFYTNYNGRKGEELAENPQAALVFYWPRLGRQIRIEGRVVKVSPRESDNYFRVVPETVNYQRGRLNRVELCGTAGFWKSV